MKFIDKPCFFIYNSTNGYNFILRFTDYAEAKEWVVATLDLSWNWTIVKEFPELD